MKRGTMWSRRQVFGAALGTTGLFGRPGAAQQVEAGDRGLGGTGAAPSEPGGDDRGIGGTGVVGTIRRFGSIVVNDLRITFPRTVAVAIDGQPARLGDLRLGHVVHVLARKRVGRLVTQRIEAFSAIVGPIDAIAGGSMTIMGQTVALPKALRRRGLRPGRWVAVSGLRRLDGVVVASLLAPRHRGADAMIAGIPGRAGDGEIRIGQLPIDDLPPEALDRRMRLSGRLVRGRLIVADAQPQWSSVLDERPDRLSIEDYVALDQGSMVLASGLPTPDAVAEATGSRETRAIVSATVTPAGQIHVQGVRTQGGDHGFGDPGGAHGPAPGPSSPGAPPPGRGPGAGPGPGPAMGGTEGPHGQGFGSPFGGGPQGGPRGGFGGGGPGGGHEGAGGPGGRGSGGGGPGGGRR